MGAACAPHGLAACAPRGRAQPCDLCVQVEMLLENYAQELGAATSLLELLAYSIESDEKFFSYRLDSVAHMHRIVHRTRIVQS